MSNPAARTAQKQLRRDRATIQAEAAKVNRSTTSAADKQAAFATIAKTVVRGTKLTTTGDTTEMLARLAVDLLNSPGTVVALGHKEAIKLKVSPEDAASIPESVLGRLRKLT